MNNTDPNYRLPHRNEINLANRLRGIAHRQGLVIVKSQRAPYRGLPYGVYHLVKASDRAAAAASAPLKIHEVEALLTSGELAHPIDAVPSRLKTCVKCGQTKPVEEFYKRTAARDGYDFSCKVCSLARSAAYHAANRDVINPRSRRNSQRMRDIDPDYSARHHLWRQFGLTIEDYESMLLAQGGGCAVCGRPPGTKRLHVDHDHNCCPGTNKPTCGKCIRGLLCSMCNTGRGIVDNPELLRKRADYIDEWRLRHAQATTQAA